MDHSSIEEHNIVERYLLGQLTAGEAGQFEEHYLDCSQCLEQLELSKRLVQGLREVAAEEGTKTVARSAVLAWLARYGRPLQGVLVLGLIAVAILPSVWLGSRISDLRGELDQALAPRPTGTGIVLSPERSAPGDEPSVQLTLTSEPEWMAFALQLPPDSAAASYRGRLVQTGGPVLWHSESLTPDAAGQVVLSIHSTWLEAADYTLELAPSSPAGGSPQVMRFPFRVRRGEYSERNNLEK
ncbi:MAG: hypothetical protein AAF657_00170 [Acidobacteriota bacterium]